MFPLLGFCEAQRDNTKSFACCKQPVNIMLVSTRNITTVVYLLLLLLLVIANDQWILVFSIHLYSILCFSSFLGCWTSLFSFFFVYKRMLTRCSREISTLTKQNKNITWFLESFKSFFSKQTHFWDHGWPHGTWCLFACVFLSQQEISLSFW